MATTTAVTKVRFADPEEGSAATVERLLGAVDYNFGPELIKTLLVLTAMACGSHRAVVATFDQGHLDKLARYRLIAVAADGEVTLLPE